ncbi:hypothetical protein MY9_2055 [Bacillus sp. JS]|nr:hypothetical protein MY9_2055 [Bacillus sp. JS]KFF56397.1 hypothetical protein CM50_10505 [Bacillus subtilis] [Bacillus stercoris]GFM13703.1 hypothetical protein FW1_contig-04-49 [Bacillus sp. FW1]
MSKATTYKHLRKNKKKFEELENGVCCCYELQKEVDGLGDPVVYFKDQKRFKEEGERCLKSE